MSYLLPTLLFINHDDDAYSTLLLHVWHYHAVADLYLKELHWVEWEIQKKWLLWLHSCALLLLDILQVK